MAILAEFKGIDRFAYAVGAREDRQLHLGLALKGLEPDWKTWKNIMVGDIPAQVLDAYVSYDTRPYLSVWVSQPHSRRDPKVGDAIRPVIDSNTV